MTTDSEREAENTSARIDLATVVYEPEISLLKLQARSMREFMSPRDLGRIFVIVNEMAPESTYSALKTHVLPEYGNLLKHVEVIPATHLMRPHVGVGGWRTQQSLKLLISSYVTTKHYLLMDAKNHFVRPITMAQLVDSRTGKARSFRVGSHGSLSAYLKNCLDYFGLEARENSLPATTPYVMVTDIVRLMIAYVVDREGMFFDDFMHQAGRNFTEFFLYYAYIEAEAGGVETHYRYGPRSAVTLFTRYPSTAEQVQALFEKAAHEGTLSFGLHKNRVAKLSEPEIALLIDFWVSRRLFPSEEEARGYFSWLLDATTRRTMAGADI